MRWLVVSRVAEPDRPPVPGACLPWLADVPLDVLAAPPALNAYCSMTNERGEIVEILPDDDTLERWERYVTREWAKWAEKASIARAVKPIYQILFTAHQQLQGRDDAYDLFVGVGLLDSRTDPAQRLHRHLFAFPAELSLDNQSGSLTLRPSAEFVNLRIETDFLPPPDRARLQPQLDELQPNFEKLGPKLSDRSAVGDLLTRLVHSLDWNTQYIDDLSPQDAPAGRARASFAPALVLRPKNARSLDELLARIQADASGPEPKVAMEATPISWRRMMEDSRVWGGEDGRGQGNDLPDRRVYFPLPSNEEQTRIVRFANGSAGVVVQGPPGTGKSHTIANLISHYLATGQRVLVTAQSAQALEVLREKMPADLQQLCVSLLGNTRSSDKDLQRSVDCILARLQDFDRAKYQRRIADLEAELTNAEIRLTGLERTLRESRAAETEVLDPVVGYHGTRAHIARRLRDERVRFTWIKDDPIPHRTSCPTFPFGWARLAEYHRSLDEGTRRRLSKQYVKLPFTPDQAIEVVERINLGRAAVPLAAQTEKMANLPSSLAVDVLRRAETWLMELQKVELEVGTDDCSWTHELRATLLRGNLVMWRTLSDEACETTAKLTDEVVAKTIKVEVTGRSVTDARRDLTRLSKHYEAGGKRRTLLVFKPPVVRQTEWVEGAVHIEGRTVYSPEDVERARRALDGWACLDGAWEVWSRWTVVRTVSPRQQTAALQHRRKLLERLLCLAADGRIITEIRPWLDEMLSAGIATVDQLLVIRRRLAEEAVLAVRAELDGFVRQLRQAIGNRDVVPAVAQLLDGLVAENIAAVSAALDTLTEERELRESHQRYTEFVSTVRDVAPKLADRIVLGEGTEDQRSAFGEFEPAWQHRCAQNWLDLILSGEKIEATHRDSRNEKVRIQDLLSQLTAERAWSEALERIDDRRRASLVAWVNAVGNIPATGLSVFRKRAVAQAFLGRCLNAIPAWVVSLGRLYETVEAKPGLFDVAIVDEASQCWLDSLVLFYLAKQVIVVGDDKQISPALFFVGDDQLAQLTTAYLRDFEYRGSFTIDSSLFDHARRYLSAGVPLREHFRCVPEIIRFSNELSYQGNPLIPLRQVGKNRLEPLKTTYLADGQRKGDINDAEAYAMVDAIARCHEDPAYEEADFGVMCLQGEAQALRIQNLLVERLGPAVFSQRKLRCGNPYAFQGDERDVMFLSMVAAPNTNNATLSTQMYQQRFNVAMSRARDQAWLFHSIQEDELGPNCLRRRVLEFFKQTPDLTIHGSSIDIPTLQLAAKRADRMTERPPTPFDSWFEVDVALVLSILGYTLSAQVQVAKRRIDLVIEGDDGVRLAVECDGEAWHGPERYEQDVFREHQLERAGWRFVRVRESLFYSDETKAIREVITACEELDIAPGDGRARSSRDAAQESMPTADIPGEHQSQAETTADDKPLFSRRIPNDQEEELWESEPESALLQGALDLTGLTEQRTGPFTGYGAKHYPDPRNAPAANVREAVLDIITTDGPLPKESLYRLYREGCPHVERAGRSLRHAVNQAVYSLERACLVVGRDEGKRRHPSEVIVKLTSHPWVDPRPVGSRRLEDVPLSELGSAMHDASHGLKPQSAPERINLYREVAGRYGVRRLMPQPLQRLGLAERVAFDSGTSDGSKLF